MHSSIEPRERLKCHELGGLRLTEFAQPPALTVPKHEHEYATILFTLQGFAADRMAGRLWECEPNSLLIRPPCEPHTHHYGRTGARCLVIEIKPPRHDAIRVLSPVLDRVGLFSGPMLSTLGLRLYMESLVMDSASELAIEGLLLEMLAHVLRESPKAKTSTTPPRWLLKAREMIHADYTQHLSLSQIAGVVGVHPAHLAEVFRITYGCTVGQYVRRLRLDHAARKVLLSDESLADISVTAGFYDQSHFTKIFKLHTGFTPAKIRATTRVPSAHTKTRQSSKLGFS